MLIDTHCHLDFPDFDPDRDAVLDRARAAGVGSIINVASSLQASRHAADLGRQIDRVYASVGIHPHDAKEYSDNALAELTALAADKKVVAIGEVGLDYYRNLSEPQAQREAFEKFIGLAISAGKPLIVHSRMAFDETLEILKGVGAGGLPGVVVHCFSGDGDQLRACLELGFFVSFTCNITYKKADALREVVRLTPLDRMMLETDAPFLSPEGKRGRRNEPAFVVEAAREVARIKGVDFEEVCGQTTENAKKFFGIL